MVKDQQDHEPYVRANEGDPSAVGPTIDLLAVEASRVAYQAEELA